jgi:hypothetical protein
MLKYLSIIICLILSPLVYGKEIKVKAEEGTLKLVDFLDACEEVARCKPSSKVQPGIPGKIISIKGVPYEIRYFSFEDTSGKISPDTSFYSYAKQKNLLPIKSSAISILPGIQFESFDFRHNPQKDGVYFSMAVRKLESD